MKESAHRPVLIVIAGPNGSGKTTITSQILLHEWLENSVCWTSSAEQNRRASLSGYSLSVPSRR